MKKQHILVIAALCLLAACHRNNNADNDFEVKTFVVNDSIKFPEEELNEWNYTDMSYYYSEVDLPVTSNEALRDSILNWIARQFDYEADYSNDIPTLIENDKQTFFFSEDSEPGYESRLSISLLEDNDRYVTYALGGYMYLGGAHGMPYIDRVTFRKTDGMLFSLELFKSTDGLNDMIKDALDEQYFGYSIDEELLVDPEEMLPMPDTQPWVENDTVHFIYQPYEIAPFAAGMPECVFPYSTMKDRLTAEGKSFFAK